MSGSRGTLRSSPLLRSLAAGLGARRGRAEHVPELAIVGGAILTMNAKQPLLPRGLLVIDDGRIRALRALRVGEPAPTAHTVLHAEGRLLMPGLVNTHVHAATTILRGAVEELPLDQWAVQARRLELRHLTREAAEVGALVAALEMVRSGTTLFNDSSFFADAVAESARRVGVRAVVSEPLFDGRSPTGRSPTASLAFTEELLGRYGGDPLVRVAFGPHYPSTCPEAVLCAAGAAARRHGAPLHIHLSEGAGHDVRGMSHTAYLRRLGLLSGQLVAAHGVHLSSADMGDLVRHGVGVAHCPESNMMLRDGIAPVAALWQAGCAVGLGTDGPLSNHDLDLFQAMDFAAKLQMLDPRRRAPVPPVASFVQMATTVGARMLGRGHDLGSLEVGKLADVILIDLDRPHLVPLYDVYAQLVHAASGADVETVIINGRIVMRDRQILTVDEHEVLERARALARRIRRDVAGRLALEPR